jgi:hypothetical protein
MSKYIPEVFENGRVVLIKEEDFDKAIENGQEIWVFCGGWSGGYAHAFGATWDGEYWQCYSYEIRDKVFTPEQMKKCYKLIVTDGVKVYMKTGEPATQYSSQFIDWDSKMENHPYDFRDTAPSEYEDLRSQLDVEGTLNYLPNGHYETNMTSEDVEELRNSIKGILY